MQTARGYNYAAQNPIAVDIPSPACGPQAVYEALERGCANISISWSNFFYTAPLKGACYAALFAIYTTGFLAGDLAVYPCCAAHDACYSRGGLWPQCRFHCEQAFVDCALRSFYGVWVYPQKLVLAYLAPVLFDLADKLDNPPFKRTSDCTCDGQADYCAKPGGSPPKTCGDPSRGCQYNSSNQCCFCPDTGVCEGGPPLPPVPPPLGPPGMGPVWP